MTAGSVREERERELTQLLLALYARSEGDLGALVSIEEANADVGLDRGTLDSRCNHLEQRGFLGWLTQAFVRVTIEGMSEAENLIRRYQLLKGKKSPPYRAALAEVGLQELYVLVERHEWDRFQVTNALYRLSKGRTDEYIMVERTLAKEVDVDEDVIWRTLRFLTKAGLIAFLDSGTVYFTDDGIEQHESLLSGLSAHKVDVTTDERGRRAYLEYVKRTWLREKGIPSPITPAERFPTPNGATWKHVEMKLIHGDAVRITVKGVTKVMNYTQMGMNDSRNGGPNRQWELLRSLARSYGTMDWGHTDATKQNQKRRERLAEALQIVFALPGDPFKSIKGGWKTLFPIYPD